MGHGFSGFTVVFDINGCSSRSSDGLCLNLGYQISESKVLISVIKKNLLRNHGFFSFALVSCQIPFFLFQLLVGYKKAKPALWCLIWFIDGVSWTCMYQYIRRIIGWYFDELLKAPKQATDISFTYAIISALPPWMFEPKWSFTPSKQSAKKTR